MTWKSSIRRSRQAVLAGSAVLLVAVLAGLGLIAFLLRDGHEPSPAVVTDPAVPATGEIGPAGTLAFSAGGSIYTVAPDGSALREAIPGDRESAWNAAPAFSPDGSQLVFTRDFDVWMATADGRDVRRLADVGEFMTPPGGAASNWSVGAQSTAWSPNGAHIMYGMARIGGSGINQVWVMQPDGTDRQQLLDQSTFFLLPTWLDGGRVAVYHGAGQVRVFRTTGEEEPAVAMLDEDRLALTAARAADGRWLVGPFTKEGPIMHGSPSEMRRLATGASPALSPDGRWFAYFQNETLRVASVDGTVDVEIVDLAPLGGRDRFFGEQSYCSFPQDLPGCSYRLPVISWARGDGGASAAVVSEPGIYLVRPDGSDLRRLPSAGRLRDSFAWAPSGNRFALAPGCQQEHELLLGAANDQNLEKLASLGREVGTIWWSPRGDTLGLTLSRGAGIAAGAALVELDAGEVTTLQGASAFYGWSHDGRRYAMRDEADVNRYERTVTIVDLETGGRMQLGDGAGGVLWSPTDDRLAVIQMRGPEEPPYSAWLATGVDIVNGDGTGRRVILPAERHGVTGAASAVAWSPDGERLLLKPGTFPFHYLVYDVDTPGQPVDLGETYKLSEGAWSPDGGHIAVERGRPDGGILIAVFPAGGGTGIEVSAGAAAQHPQFSPDSQHIAFVARRAGDWDAQDLYLADTDDGVPIMLSEVGMTIFDVAWSADGTYIEFTAGPVTADGCDGIATTAPEPPDQLVWESEDGRVIASGLPRPCGDAATAQAYGMPMTLEIAVSRMFVIPTLLGLEAEPYEYVPAQVVDYGGDWVRALEGWELTQRNVLNPRAHPNRMTVREIFLRRLDQPSLLFRYSSDLCEPDGSPTEPAERHPALTLELPQDLPHIVVHREGGYLSAQEVIGPLTNDQRPGVRPVWAELGTSADFAAALGERGFPPLTDDPNQVIWVVVLELGDHWGPKRPGHEHGSYSVIDALTGEGLAWGCCLDLITSP